MKTKHVLLIVAVIPFLLFFSSCSLFTTMNAEDAKNAVSDAETIQAMMPGLDATLSLYQTPEGTKTIYPTANNGLPSTPTDTYSQYNSSGIARYPSSGYIDNLYGTQGYQAYLELRTVSDSWGDYQVKLYIYPTLSPEIEYTVETYRVKGDSWDPVNLQGDKDFTAYESIQTVYFDGRTENRTVNWTSDYNNPEVFQSADLTIPDDPNDLDNPPSSFDTITDLQTVAGNSGDYASITVSEIPGTPESGYVSTKAKEFYEELATGDKYSKSYVFTDLTSLGIDSTTRTVRVYKEDSNGNKQVRSKTVGSFAWRRFKWDTTTTEKIDITVNTTTGVTSYHAITKKTRDSGSTTSSLQTEITLTETGEDTNVFEGTEVITNSSGSTTYSITLDSSGMTTKNSSGSTVVNYPLSDITANPLINISLSNGTFKGRKIGRILKGIFTNKNGKQATFILSKHFLKISSAITEYIK